MALNFQGAGSALTADGLAAASDRLSVNSPEIWTVLSVETGGCGFLPDRRPQIRFERHVFSRLTNGQFDICDVSNPQSGGYDADGAHQHDRLAVAIGMNRAAALASASWGLSQIMGENFKEAGFGDAESMVAAMCGSEDAQLSAFAAFIQSKNLVGHLQSHEWTDFARAYNGPNFADNQYDTKLAAAFAVLSAGPLPDLDLRTAQLYLTFAGFNPHGVDGRMGQHTQSALIAYQQQHGLPQTGLADAATLASLTSLAASVG